LYGKNGFAKAFKNLTKYRSENNLLDYQNNYVKRLNWMLEYQNFCNIARYA